MNVHGQKKVEWEIDPILNILDRKKNKSTTNCSDNVVIVKHPCQNKDTTTELSAPSREAEKTSVEQMVENIINNPQSFVSLSQQPNRGVDEEKKYYYHNTRSNRFSVLRILSNDVQAQIRQSKHFYDTPIDDDNTVKSRHQVDHLECNVSFHDNNSNHEEKDHKFVVESDVVNDAVLLEEVPLDNEQQHSVNELKYVSVVEGIGCEKMQSQRSITYAPSDDDDDDHSNNTESCYYESSSFESE